MSKAFPVSFMKLVAHEVKSGLSKKNAQTCEGPDNTAKQDDVMSVASALSDNPLEHYDKPQKDHVISTIVDFETRDIKNTTLTEAFAISLHTVISSMDKKRRNDFLLCLSELAIVSAGSNTRVPEDLVWKRNLQTVIDETQSCHNQIVFEYDGDVRFSHRMWEMFFYAFYLLYYADMDKFVTACRHLSQNERTIDIVLFLHGLCKHRSFLSFAQTIKGGMAFYKKQSTWSKFLKVSRGCLPRQFLNLCRSARERNDHGILAKSLPNEILLTGPIHKRDLISLGFVMSKVKRRRIYVDIWMPQFQHCDLTDVLNIVERSTLQLRNIRLFRTMVTTKNAEVICKFFGSVTDLVLKECEVTSQVVKTLTSAVHHHRLEVLDLSGNIMESEVFQNIGECLHNVDALVLANCNVTAGETPYFVAPVGKLKEPLQILDLSGNNIGRSGIADLLGFVDGQPKIMEIITDPLHVNYRTSVAKAIGSKGGFVEVGGCQISIPENAVLTQTEIKLTREEPDEKDCLTPVLFCEPKDLQFHAKIEVTLPTCYILDGHTSVNVKIQKLKEGEVWTDIDVIKYNYGKQIRFKTNHFCRFRALGENADDMCVEKSLIFAMRPLVSERTSQVVISIFVFDNLPHEKELGGKENIHETIFKFRSSSNPNYQVHLQGTESLTIEDPLLEYKQIRLKPKIERQVLLKVSNGEKLASQKIMFKLIDVADSENPVDETHFYIPEVTYNAIQHSYYIQHCETVNFGTETHLHSQTLPRTNRISRDAHFRRSTPM